MIIIRVFLVTNLTCSRGIIKRIGNISVSDLYLVGINSDFWVRTEVKADEVIYFDASVFPDGMGTYCNDPRVHFRFGQNLYKQLNKKEFVVTAQS